MNWEEFAGELRQLSERINHNLEIIVGISRGGIIPARLLSSYLNTKDMYCLTIKKIGNERRVLTELLCDLNDKKVLLVEDQLETGKSLITAKEYLAKKGAKVKTACLYIMQNSEIIPDFYLRQVNSIQNFPWE